MNEFRFPISSRSIMCVMWKKFRFVQIWYFSTDVYKCKISHFFHIHHGCDVKKVSIFPNMFFVGAVHSVHCTVCSQYVHSCCGDMSNFSTFTVIFVAYVVLRKIDNTSLCSLSWLITISDVHQWASVLIAKLIRRPGEKLTCIIIIVVVVIIAIIMMASFSPSSSSSVVPTPSGVDP